MATVVTGIIIGVLSFGGSLISGHAKHKYELQERLITDAEKQCFEGPEEKRNCDPLNELTKKFIIRKVKVKSFTGSSVTVSPDSPNEEK